MFTTGMMESRQEKVDMVDVEPQAMELLVSYAYTSEVVISTENVQVMYYHSSWSVFIVSMFDLHLCFKNILYFVNVV